MTNDAKEKGVFTHVGNRTRSKSLGSFVPRKRKLSSSRSKPESDVRFGYFTLPNDVSDGSDQGSKDSDSDDVGVEIITEAEFKNKDDLTASKKREKFSDVVVRDVSSEDLTGSSSSSDDSETSSDDSFPDDDYEVDKSDEVESVEVSMSETSASEERNLDKRQSSDDASSSKQTKGGKKHKKKADSPSLSNQENVGECKKRKRSNQASDSDLCRMLADSMLGRGTLHETNKNQEEETRPVEEAQAQTVPLPLKFRFEEDEEPKKAEKTEAEIETEGLFALMDFCLMSQADDIEVDPEVENTNAEVENTNAEETSYERCARGKHELIWIDDQGLICGYCYHVELGPKDVMPPWAVRTGREYERRKYSEPEQHHEFDEIHLKTPNDVNHQDSSFVASGTVWSLKPSIRKNMYHHQRDGFEFLWKNLAGTTNLNELKTTETSTQVGGCIISHAPGTGKTCLALVFIETYMKMFPSCRPVIIAPAGMLLTWEEEFKKWNVDVHFLNLNNNADHTHGNKKMIRRMLNLYSWSQGKTVLGISYSLFEKLSGEKFLNKKLSLDSRAKDLRQILLEKPGLVILDEGHTPRNQRSNIWNALLKLQTKKRVILSGTPFQNNFSELFNTLRIVRPEIADSLAQEKPLAEMLTSGRKYKSRNVDLGVKKLKTAMLPFVHVHKGRILQQNLPGLRDCVVLLNPPALQKSLIERLEGRQTTFKLEHKSALLSVHPYLLKHSKITDKEKIGIDMAAVEASKLNHNEGVKTKFIIEFIRLCMATNEKVLVFSQYIHPLHLIKEQLEKIFQWSDGNEVLLMKGCLDQKQRQVLINLFNVPGNMSKVMLASTKCCSEGISLVGASRVILLDVVWNPSVERQAISRAYRIGQDRFVYTYHLMTLGTSEADKYCRQAEKDRLSELVFTSSSNETSKLKAPCGGIEDRILEAMVDRSSLKDMFVKIINQPKDTNLIQSFGS